MKRVPLFLSFALLTFFVFAPPSLHAGSLVVDAFGDSITSGVPYYTSTSGNGCLPPCGGYEPALQTLLNSSGRTSTVRNYGVRGDTSADGLKRIDSVMATTSPNYILLLEGTNDILFVSPYSVRSNLNLMVDKALARSSVPVVGTLTPDTITSYKLINLTNTLLRELAAQKGVPLADLHSATAPNWSAYTADGLHPNRTGYNVMARTWYNAMVAWEEEQRIKSLSFLPSIYHLLLSD